MTRDRWEQVLFEHVPDEVVQDMLNQYVLELESENAKLREYVAVSIPLPLDGNRSAIHPDDIMGNNVNGTDFFGRVTEMHLTRYPQDGQPALWVVRTEDGDGKVTPYVCWGGRCNAVHKQASQTYSAEYLETYDENKRVKDENAKLREQYETVLADYRLEVAKLRELVRDMYEMAYPEYPSAFEVAFADRMCELGVEANG